MFEWCMDGVCGCLKVSGWCLMESVGVWMVSEGVCGYLKVSGWCLMVSVGDWMVSDSVCGCLDGI